MAVMQPGGRNRPVRDWKAIKRCAFTRPTSIRMVSRSRALHFMLVAADVPRVVERRERTRMSAACHHVLPTTAVEVGVVSVAAKLELSEPNHYLLE